MVVVGKFPSSGNSGSSPGGRANPRVAHRSTEVSASQLLKGKITATTRRQVRPGANIKQPMKGLLGNNQPFLHCIGFRYFLDLTNPNLRSHQSHLAPTSNNPSEAFQAIPSLNSDDKKIDLTFDWLSSVQVMPLIVRNLFQNQDYSSNG